MATSYIRTSTSHTVCELCGRTLLRGERSVVYINGAARKSVCELCGSRALHEGWVREGTIPPYDESRAPMDRRPSLLNRLRTRRSSGRAASAPTLADELDEQSWAQSDAARERERQRDRVREPRHVRAVPTSVEQKAVSAVKLFNGSEHRRTIAGVARSLGPPTVSVLASPGGPSVVNIVVSWELCWYRYEVDLSDDEPSVRVAGQGYELDELSGEERHPVASTDDHGSLALVS